MPNAKNQKRQPAPQEIPLPPPREVEPEPAPPVRRPIKPIGGHSYFREEAKQPPKSSNITKNNLRKRQRSTRHRRSTRRRSTRRRI